MKTGEIITRRLLPRVVVAESKVDVVSRLSAATRRRIGRQGTVELYLSFDDPWSAVALLDLADRVPRHGAGLVVRPVIDRGIPDDPAVELKRRYALTDAKRLAERLGLVLTRSEPWDAIGANLLAEWVACAPQGPTVTRFCVERAFAWRPRGGSGSTARGAPTSAASGGTRWGIRPGSTGRRQCGGTSAGCVCAASTTCRRPGCMDSGSSRTTGRPRSSSG
jgi:hypothetical protein